MKKYISIWDKKMFAKPILSTIAKRGGKYFKAFIAPTMRQAAISGGVNTVANIFDYWMQKFYESNIGILYG